MTEPNLCPECTQGKCRNCCGEAWDHELDMLGGCDCPDPIHTSGKDRR